MHKFDHPNVISLIGLCLSAGPSPCIILPFMENGSLLSYVKNNRAILHTNSNTETEIVSESFNQHSTFLRYHGNQPCMQLLQYSYACGWIIELKWSL